MPIVEIEGFGSHDVQEGTRLVNAIIDAGADIGHRCGGFARCTTCRVEFKEGEPGTMTRAEFSKLKQSELFGQARLSCQILVDRDMRVRPLLLASQMTWDSPGKQPEQTVTPEAAWFSVETLQAETAQDEAR